MKIAFVGSHSCGKTTAAHYTVSYLKQHGFNNVMFGPEIARRCPYPIGEHADFRTQAWILCNQIEQEIELESKADIVILDRSVLDVEVYSHYLFSRQKLKLKEMEWILTVANKWMRTKPYDAILFMTPLELVSDWARGENVDFQLKVNRLFESYIRYAEALMPYSLFFKVTDKERTKRSQAAAETVLRIVEAAQK